VLATPHIGYVTEELYRTFYGDAATSIAAWLESNPAKGGTTTRQRADASATESS
jgi:phosphoglycerate dehydrogenase-like enzyme